MPAIQGMTRNFYFTTEARYLFRYEGGAQTLSFFGDDDVWVFVNGKLVLDLGAPHERLEGTVTLEGDNASYVIHTQQVTTGAPIAVPGGAGTVAGLGLVAGGTYEIAVFHADRHPRESNYQLTLFGFNTTRSLCQPHCGDGLVALGEECDNGEANADGLYGGCTTNCKFGPFCGDGAVNGEELCDLGRENGLPYNTQGPGGCTTACTPSHYCGDGIIDSRFGEECDLGPEGDRSLCTNACTVAIQ
jgi:fibro-slime domain-containing protein